MFQGTPDGTVYAIDRTSGRTVWTYKTDYAIESTPAVSGHRVFVGNDGDHVYAFAATTGRKLWEWRGPGSNFYSPVAIGDVVYVIPGRARSGLVVAVDAASGRELWRYPGRGFLQISASGVTKSSIYVSVYRGNKRYDVEELDSRTGRVGWSRPFHTGNDMSAPVVANGRVYVGGGAPGVSGFGPSIVYTLDAATGRRDWQYRPKATEGETFITVSGGVVYAGFGESQGLVALQSRDGSVMWKANGTCPAQVAPVVSGQVVYAGNCKELDGFDAATGSPIVRYSGLWWSGAPPSVVDGRVYTTEVLGVPNGLGAELTFAVCPVPS